MVGRAVTVLVVGRNDLMRRGLSSIAERGGLRVVAECPTPGAGLEALKRVRADVVVLDAETEDASVSNLAALAAACPLLVLVPDGDMTAALGALQAGARGCVSRSSPGDVLLAEIYVAAYGETVIPRSMAQELLRSIDAESRRRPRRSGLASHPPGSVDVAGDRGARAGRPRVGQRPHRGSPLHQPSHCEEPHREHPGEAGAREPRSGGRVRGA